MGHHGKQFRVGHVAEEIIQWCFGGDFAKGLYRSRHSPRESPAICHSITLEAIARRITPDRAKSSAAFPWNIGQPAQKTAWLPENQQRF